MGLHELNFSEEEQGRITKEQFKEVLQVFRKELYHKQTPTYCRLHNILDTDESNHNCLGCNLADTTDYVKSMLSLTGRLGNFNKSYTAYLLTLYLMVERIEVLFSIMSLPDSYIKKNFKTFSLIRKWANFIKHPKAFMLVHHPEFTYEGSEKNQQLLKEAHKSKTINYNFLVKYYSGNENNEELFGTLTNKDDILVVFPNPVVLIREFCECCSKFLSVIEKNEIYHEILKDSSTFYSYWLPSITSSSPQTNSPGS